MTMPGQISVIALVPFHKQNMSAFASALSPSENWWFSVTINYDSSAILRQGPVGADRFLTEKLKNDYCLLTQTECRALCSDTTLICTKHTGFFRCIRNKFLQICARPHRALSEQNYLRTVALIKVPLQKFSTCSHSVVVISVWWNRSHIFGPDSTASWFAKKAIRSSWFGKGMGTPKTGLQTLKLYN